MSDMPNGEFREIVTGPGRVALHDQIKADALATLKACKGTFLLLAEHPENPCEVRVCLALTSETPEHLLKVCNAFLGALGPCIADIRTYGIAALAAIREGEQEDNEEDNE